MLPLPALLLLSTLGAVDTVVIGRVDRNLTGDGKPEVLRLVGTGKSIDSLDVTLTIQSGGVTVYRMAIGPLTRREGFDASSRMRTRAEQRKWLAEFPRWFFDKDKFRKPAAFLDSWRSQGEHVDELPGVIARDGGFYPDTVRAKSVWAEIRRSGVTVFEFSPGGDAIVAIAWSARDARFYRLIECC